MNTKKIFSWIFWLLFFIIICLFAGIIWLAFNIGWTNYVVYHTFEIILAEDVGSSPADQANNSKVEEEVLFAKKENNTNSSESSTTEHSKSEGGNVRQRAQKKTLYHNYKFNEAIVLLYQYLQSTGVDVPSLLTQDVADYKTQDLGWFAHKKDETDAEYKLRINKFLWGSCKLRLNNALADPDLKLFLSETRSCTKMQMHKFEERYYALSEEVACEKGTYAEFSKTPEGQEALKRQLPNYPTEGGLRPPLSPETTSVKGPNTGDEVFDRLLEDERARIQFQLLCTLRDGNLLKEYPGLLAIIEQTSCPTTKKLLLTDETRSFYWSFKLPQEVIEAVWAKYPKIPETTDSQELLNWVTFLEAIKQKDFFDFTDKPPKWAK